MESEERTDCRMGSTSSSSPSSPFPRLSTPGETLCFPLERLLVWKRPSASNIMSSSSSVTWFWEPRARCSANLFFSSSSPMGSPDEFRSTLKRRVRLYQRRKHRQRRTRGQRRVSGLLQYDRGKEAGTYSGKISDVRKSLAGGNDGRTSCVSVRGLGPAKSVLPMPWGRLASDLLLEGERRNAAGRDGR